MSNDFEMYTLREELREIKEMLYILVEKLGTESIDEPRKPFICSHALSIPDEAWTEITGILSFEEVCLALDVKNTRANQIQLGAMMKNRGVKQVRTRTQRFYSFPCNVLDDMKKLESYHLAIKANIKNMKGNKTLEQVMEIADIQKTPLSMSITARALRLSHIPRDGGAGVYIFSQ